MLYAISITVLAGLATSLGGVITLLIKNPKEKTMAFSLGFAASVMVTVSLTDMLPHCVSMYTEYMPSIFAAFAAVSLCILGMVVARLLSELVPEISTSSKMPLQNAKALKSAIVTTVALIAHNLPEGVLTLFSSVQDPKFGSSIALAVALHNIPEGIAISVPIYYATNNKLKGFIYAFVAGVAEPIGALLAFGLFSFILTPLFLNGLVAGVSGIMLFVCFNELLPESFSYNKKIASVLGLCVGVIVMFVGIYIMH